MTSPNDPQGAPSPQYPSGPHTPTQQIQPPQSATSNGIAVTALVLGIVAFVTGAAPFWGLLVGAAAVVVGIMALLRRQQKSFGIVGIVGGAIGFVTSVVTTWLTVVALSAGVAVVSELATTTPTVVFETPTAIGTTTPTDSTETGEQTVHYEVTGDGGPAIVTFTTATGGNISQQQDTEAALPWTATATAPEPGEFEVQSFSVTAVAAPDATTITCRISVNGEILSEQTSTGGNALVTCDVTNQD